MGVAESRNDRFYQLCGLGKTHLVERMLEADKDLKTININWQNYEVCRRHARCWLVVAGQVLTRFVFPEQVYAVVDSECKRTRENCRNSTQKRSRCQHTGRGKLGPT